MRKGPIYRSSSSSSNTSNTSIKTTGSSASINENNDFESCGSDGYNNNNNNNNNNDDVTATDIINNHRTKTTKVNNNNNSNNNTNTINNNNNNNNLETISLSSHTSSSSFKYLYSVNSISESELEQDYQNERQQFLCDNNNHAIDNGTGGGGGVNKKLTYVQRMKQQFEVLASAEKNSSNNCQKCNWWIKSPQSGIVDNEQFTIETPSPPTPPTTTTTTTTTPLNESEHIFQRHTRVIKKKSDWLNHRQSNASASLIENEINNNNNNNNNNINSNDAENGCRIVKIKESLIRPAVSIPKIDYRQLINDQKKNEIKEENIEVVAVAVEEEDEEEEEEEEVIENAEEVNENIEVDDTADVVHNINIHSEEQLSDFEENDVQQMSDEIIDTTNQIIFKEVNVHVANDHDVADDVDEDADDNFSDSFDSHTSEDEDMENNNTLKVQETQRPASLSSVSSNKLTNIIQELLENEETYIKSLRHGVEGYISIFNERNLPNTLRGQKYSIFGNIERIKSFHANEFYPALQKCSEDIEKIAQTFIKYIQEDYFYYYVLYAINRDKSERMCELNKDFFKERQNTIGDKLGINSFLVQPIQRLPKYSLLLNELIKELGKNLENSKDPIAACCIAQKNIQRLLDTVNESMSINDVIECNDINIHHQGKFQKVSKFDIWDSPLRKKYQGKVFLFDKCVIYTEILDEKRLHFRGYFPRETTGFTFEDGRNKFILYVSKRGQQEIEFSADFTTIQLWIKLLTNMLMKTVELEKQKIEEKRRQRHSTAIEGGTLNVIVRINSANSKHSTSTNSNNTYSNSSSSNSSTPWTSGGSSSRESGASVSSVMSTNSNHSRTSSDSNRTTWYAKLV